MFKPHQEIAQPRRSGRVTSMFGALLALCACSERPAAMDAPPPTDAEPADAAVEFSDAAPPAPALWNQTRWGRGHWAP
jgi:hypothetical protein